MFSPAGLFLTGSGLRSCHGSVKLYLCALPHPVEERGGVTSSSLAFKATGTQSGYSEQGCEVRLESRTQPVEHQNTHLHYLLCANPHSQQLTPVRPGIARHCPSLWCCQPLNTFVMGSSGEKPGNTTELPSTNHMSRSLVTCHCQSL